MRLSFSRVFLFLNARHLLLKAHLTLYGYFDWGLELKSFFLHCHGGGKTARKAVITSWHRTLWSMYTALDANFPVWSHDYTGSHCEQNHWLSIEIFSSLPCPLWTLKLVFKKVLAALTAPAVCHWITIILVFVCVWFYFTWNRKRNVPNHAVFIVIMWDSKPAPYWNMDIMLQAIWCLHQNNSRFIFELILFC